MAHSWQLRRDASDTAGDARPAAGAALDSAAVEKPVTPPTVRNVTPSTCMSMVQFRALMQEYRALDDTVTTRMNRALANSRSSGLTQSPSILSGHIPSVSSRDLGKSTYANAPQQACLTFWRELVNVWIGREEVLQYCLKVEQYERAQRGDLGTDAKQTSALRRSREGEEWLLNDDVERERRAALLRANDNKAKYDSFDSRASRSEDSFESLRRQMRNELAVEAIIRKRSLDAFKSRCRFFEPIFTADQRGAEERAMWEGRETQASRAAQQ